jgi:hypothetical protein
MMLNVDSNVSDIKSITLKQQVLFSSVNLNIPPIRFDNLIRLAFKVLSLFYLRIVKAQYNITSYELNLGTKYSDSCQHLVRLLPMLFIFLVVNVFTVLVAILPRT